ncbi:hypothetical protein F2Q68_00009951 [Brassica cretica]|uniref:Bifunctional inhibitor/plant lipid transfer protein/seed storage helical domain-containing protein n=1 Tax=Brassica cretica TaxID=69181 RepID=A0A8S9KY90_BRACR|nr:hypothetical protein F2Q68_00009951 [Brassica cretica]
MKQSLLSILILLLSSSFAPIHARNKPQPANSPSPVASPAPGPSNSDCSSIIYDMMDCLSYLTPGSNDTTPTKVCCGGILSVLQYNPKCICVGLESSKTMGFAVNNTRARAMPTTCKLPIVAPHCGESILDEATPAASTAGMSPNRLYSIKMQRLRLPLESHSLLHQADLCVADLSWSALCAISDLHVRWRVITDSGSLSCDHGHWLWFIAEQYQISTFPAV